MFRYVLPSHASAQTRRDLKSRNAFLSQLEKNTFYRYSSYSHVRSSTRIRSYVFPKIKPSPNSPGVHVCHLAFHCCDSASVKANFKGNKFLVTHGFSPLSRASIDSGPEARITNHNGRENMAMIKDANLWKVSTEKRQGSRG